MRKFSTEKYFQKSVIRRYRKTAAFAVLGVCTGVFIVLNFQSQLAAQRISPIIQETQTQSEAIQTAMEESLPLRLRVPSIGVDAPFEAPLGVDKNYEIEVPESYDTLGWYKYGPTPGEIGPAVVLGHVDSYQGPAVLYKLGQVKVGELIEIDREDGSTAVFKVEALERHEQSGFPTEKVYSDLEYPGLRLITCTGTYDKGIQRYSHNLIVFARLLEDETEAEQGAGEEF
jgi:hypothetical protein